MKLVDLNLLLYAVDASSPRHQAARSWWESVLAGPETVALPWAVLVGFIRLSTKATVFTRPLSSDEALDIVEGWLAQPAVITVAPGARHAAVLRELLSELGTAGNLVSDAHLAALAIEHGCELCSCDTDFLRFTGLRWTDPLR